MLLSDSVFSNFVLICDKSGPASAKREGCNLLPQSRAFYIHGRCKSVRYFQGPLQQTAGQNELSANACS